MNKIMFWKDSRKLSTLAIPMVVSNISVPLVGLVDTAIVGHMGNTSLLAGVSLGGLIITQLYWICGFLRMSTTGLSANAYGAEDRALSSNVLTQSFIFSLLLGLLILGFHSPIFQFGVWIAQPDSVTSQAADAYFFIRVIFAPIALCNLSLIGWMIGQQMHKKVMFVQVVSNLLNIGLSYLLAITFEMGVTGVAIATVIAELLVFSLSLSYVFASKYNFSVKDKLSFMTIVDGLKTNHAMFIRNLLLQLSIAFITYSGLRISADIGATNAILMQFFVLIALGLDGLAYAIEALVGSAQGKKDQVGIHKWVKLGSFWSSLVAVFYSGIFYVLGSEIIGLLTDIPNLQALAEEYFLYVVLLPLIAHWCFLFDGIYIGLLNAAAMRNTMLLSALFGLLPVWFFNQSLENHGLWMAFLTFLGVRGVTLVAHYWRNYR